MKKMEIRAVELVREIRDRLYEETHQMSPEELQAFIASEAARAGFAPDLQTRDAKQPAA
jgi:hypothetical protein